MYFEDVYAGSNFDFKCNGHIEYIIELFQIWNEYSFQHAHNYIFE